MQATTQSGEPGVLPLGVRTHRSLESKAQLDADPGTLMWHDSILGMVGNPLPNDYLLSVL